MNKLAGVLNDPHLLCQGFVQKLVENPITASESTPLIPGLFVDVDWNKNYGIRLSRPADSRAARIEGFPGA